MKTLTLYPSAIQNTFGNFNQYFESFLREPAASMPSVDIKETDNAYLLDMELPGYDEKNIEVNIDGSNLTITSKQEEKAEDAGRDEKAKVSYILKERRGSSFKRTFKLPENANPEAVNAAFKNGVLSLQIQKRAEAQKRTIQINAA